MKKTTIFFIAFLMLLSANIFAANYNLYVAGVQVTDANKDNITAAVVAAGKTASGIITYDPTTNMLTLNNATINLSTNNDLRAIQNSISNLSIELIGQNNVTAKYHSITFEGADATITGTGSLNVTSTSKTAIYPANCNLTILNTTVTATGSAYGIRGDESSNRNLIITNSTVRATGTDGGSIRYINDLVLNGCAITQPATAVFNASQHAVYYNGTLVTTEVLIEPVITYDLYVANVRVSEANKDNITAAVVAAAGQTASGTITYNSETNTLTLNNASISASAIGIKNYISNLTINLLGENSITAGDDGIESYEEDFTIIGTGSLTINAMYGIHHRDCNLTIENTSVTATGISSGILGTASGILTIINSTVRATGTNEGSIRNMYNLVLNGCAITQPEGAAFDAYYDANNEYIRGVYLNEEIVKGEVIIAPLPTISVSDATSCGTYTLPTSTTNDTWSWTNESNETVTEATESGIYTVVATSNLGATATASITVIINQSVTNEITEIACGSFEWNGTTYDASGDYSETFTAENGCDSIVTLHLTINEIVTNEITEIACGSFEWNGTTYDASGDYDQTFTAENGCDSVVTLHLTINELPTVEITQEGEILTATAGMETYAWNTNETSESITISATGNYSVTVTNSEGCENTADIEVTEIPTTGINEIAVSKIAVYPNPNNGEFTINLGGIDNAISYQVIDAKGAIVKEAKVNSNEEFVSIQAKAGNYTIKVISDSKVFVEQIIVQ